MITRKNNDLWFVTFIDICNINSTNKDCIRKTIVGWWYKPQGEGNNFNQKGKGLPLCNCVVLKLYCFSVYCKRFYRITFFPKFLLWYLFCIYWDWQRQKGNLKYTKVYEINSELYCYCNLCLYSFLQYKHLYLQPHKNKFVSAGNLQYLNKDFLKSTRFSI